MLGLPRDQCRATLITLRIPVGLNEGKHLAYALNTQLIVSLGRAEYIVSFLLAVPFQKVDLREMS